MVINRKRNAYTMKSNKKKPSLRVTPKGPKRKATARKKTPKKGKWTVRIFTVVLLSILAGIIYILSLGREGHHGIDVSHHQGIIDWQKVGEEADLEFAFVKATEGLEHNDTRFTHNLHGARSAGLKVGAYHFFQPNQDGLQQFNHFYRVVGKDIDLKPVLDLESVSSRTIMDEDYNKQVKLFIDACQRQYGCFPIIYASPSFVKDHHLDHTIQNCPYWIAWYPMLPNVIASHRRFLMARYPGTQAIAWQYSDRGCHEGINGHVDLDICWEMASIEL